SIQLRNFIDRHMKILQLRINGRTTKIHINEILYVEAMLRKVRIVTIDQEIIYKSSFSNFLKLYSNRTLIQTQRSYAVNISQVKSVGSSDILLSNNEYLPISEKYKKNFIEQYKKIIYFKFNT
uniref:LytR/AlgR family response regulator transcription factor n=4 Tax=Coprobacillaceae TaxID=2810280 RepID=UPI002605540E